MQTETNTTENKIEILSSSVLKMQTRALNEYADNIRLLLSFIEDHQAQLAGVHWSACHIYCEVTFVPATASTDVFEHSARAIARRFPGIVWHRKKNTSTCGSLDWRSSLDNVGLRIENAETIRWIPEPESVIEVEQVT